MSRIAIFGAGYVGLVTGACFADLGHDVVVRDVVPEKIDALRRGEVPIYEPGLDDLLVRNADRLTFTLDVDDLVGCEFLFVCVDTPPTYSGDADLSRVWTVIDELPELDGRPILVMKSTVPVGTGEKIRAGLEDRDLAASQYLHPLGDDFANGHVVAQLREAGRGDQTDVAAAKDRDPRHRGEPSDRAV